MTIDVLEALPWLVVALLLAPRFMARRPAQSVPTPPPQVRDELATELSARLASLETKVAGLPSLWETERQRVEEQADISRRAAARIEQASRRAAKVADGGAEAEPNLPGIEIRPAVRNGDAYGSGARWVQPMYPGVAPVPEWTPPHKLR